ncbi:MAG: hypothetical protein HQL24_02145 [Candidatus Omnitrophica bacterium]|nr:hypothetical protein [Candidatus Omnitrophota bacterium]
MLRSLKKNGFASMIEVVVTSIIFIIAAFGIFTTITSLRPHAVQSSKKLKALYLGKGIIDDLRGYIDAQVWNDPDSLLSVNIEHTQTIDTSEGNFEVTWWLQQVANSDVRKLQMTIDYPDQ